MVFWSLFFFLERKEEINNNPEWDPEQLQELCYRADMEDAWEQSTDETFEAVINEAADKLEIDITGSHQLDRLEKEEKRHSYEDLDI